MKEIMIKKFLPENPNECSKTDCDECVFACGSHSESIFHGG